MTPDRHRRERRRVPCRRPPPMPMPIRVISARPKRGPRRPDQELKSILRVATSKLDHQPDCICDWSASCAAYSNNAIYTLQRALRTVTGIGARLMALMFEKWEADHG